MCQQIDDWEVYVNEELIAGLCDFFKAEYTGSMASATDLFTSETDMLECLVRLGRAAVSRLFKQVGNGYVAHVPRRMAWRCTLWSIERGPCTVCSVR